MADFPTLKVLGDFPCVLVAGPGGHTAYWVDIASE